MEFGKVTQESLEEIDFKMPQVPVKTLEIIQKNKDKQVKIKTWVGCPVWANKDWVGNFYPLKTKAKDFLKNYTKQFNTIELNVTHYKIPDNKTIERWKNEANKGFVYCPKVFQEISHQAIAQRNFKELTLYFAEQILKLEEFLGISFLQLPPYFSPEYYNHLEEFLAFFPREIPLSVEFRHPAWFRGNNFEQAAELLEKYKCHTVITDVAGRRDVLHLRLTSPIVFLRFVGNDLHRTDFQRVDAWIELFKDWKNLGLQEIYFFAHEPDNILAPDLAKYFMEQFNLHLKENLKLPKNYQETPQSSLF